MSRTITTPCLTLLGALALATAGCHDNAGQSDAQPSASASDDSDAIGDAPSAAADDSPKSILRPDVLPEGGATEAPKIEPAHIIVPFGASGLKLDDAGKALVDSALASPAAGLGGPIILRGSTDSHGSDGDNKVSSRKRAEAVRAYMVSKGVPRDRISVIALGETRPIAPNANEDGSDNPEGRARNRRVEIEIDLPAPPPSDAPSDKPSDAGSPTPAPSPTPAKRSVKQ
ncbi:OmpA family protein [Novosphingobium sp. 9]|uniref:OmpA family protein n=1 Tax=Novosphingobium sp. 9 TaxID=2025349 RepID=UPI0021B65D2A|nr:OmpA family protein [Novosphingobium sp. 9]